MSRNRIVFKGLPLLSLQPTCAIFVEKFKKNMKRRVFVTGGARGIGKGIVEAFTRQGDEVVFCDIDPELGARTAAGTGARFCQLDVTDAAGLEGCMQQLFETLGDIDILVNNVGIGLFKPLDEFSIEEFDRVIATNLRPVFITSRQLALHRRRNGNRRYGRIINLCSTRYLQSEAGTEAYSASKGETSIIHDGLTAEDLRFIPVLFPKSALGTVSSPLCAGRRTSGNGACCSTRF